MSFSIPAYQNVFFILHLPIHFLSCYPWNVYAVLGHVKGFLFFFIVILEHFSVPSMFQREENILSTHTRLLNIYFDLFIQLLMFVVLFLMIYSLIPSISFQYTPLFIIIHLYTYLSFPLYLSRWCLFVQLFIALQNQLSCVIFLPNTKKNSCFRWQTEKYSNRREVICSKAGEDYFPSSLK